MKEWNDKRIQDAVTTLDDKRHIHIESRNHIVELLTHMRNEYEAKVDELESRIGTLESELYCAFDSESVSKMMAEKDALIAKMDEIAKADGYCRSLSELAQSKEQAA